MITYAGETLLLADPGRQFNDWLDRLLSLEDFGPIGDPLSYSDGRCNPRGDWKAFVGIPRSNWRFRPRWKLNSLWWPTGAARWATGLFLTDEETLDRIAANLDSQGGAALKLSIAQPGEDATEVETTMYLLPPRQVTTDTHTIEGDPQPKLWLLPLVDQRYFWQFKDAGLLEVTEDSDWSAVIATIGAGLGVTVSFDDIAGAYEQPDPEALTRRYENAAVLLDAVAWSLGQRIVANLDGTIIAQSYTNAHTAYSDNVSDKTQQSAGGEYYGQRTELAAETVRVVFPRYKDGVPQADGNVYSVSTGNAAAGGPSSALTVPGTTKTFFDTAMADFTGDPIQPLNYERLVTLTKQVARDYYGYLIPDLYDLTFAGVLAWQPCGFDDWVWWHVGYQYPGRPVVAPHDAPSTYGEYGCFTRACSMPYNWGFTELLHQFPQESSSSSSSTSSSAFSESSQTTSSSSQSTSARTYTIVVDVCCDDGDIVVVTRDFTFDGVGRLVGVSKPDPEGACSGA